MSTKPTARELVLQHTGSPTLDPAPYLGEVVQATIIGTDLRLSFRWGTSALGQGWEPITGDFLGCLPTDCLADIKR